MANTLEYAKVFQTSLDKQIVQESTTGWMEANAGQVKYNGGNEVKIPSITMDGLADYDRGTGFVDGAVTLAYQTHKLTQDRGRSFSLDAMDVDETNFVATAGNVMGEFQRVKVVPEIDAYRYATIATLAIEAEQTRDLDAPAADTIVDELLTDLNNLEDAIGGKEVVITMNPVLAGKLAKGGKDYVSTAMLAKGAASVEVQTFNDNPIVRASSKVLHTEITIGEGFTMDGQEINWLITAKDAPIAISKTEKVRIFTPDQNQVADAYKLDYRKYHDVWVPENKLPSIYANVVPAGD